MKKKDDFDNKYPEVRTIIQLRIENEYYEKEYIPMLKDLIENYETLKKSYDEYVKCLELQIEHFERNFS